MDSPQTLHASPAIGSTPETDGDDILQGRFKDLDNLDVYKDAKQRVVAEKTQNFVVQFSHDAAHIAFDLSGAEMWALLKESPPEGKVRWINVWTPDDHRTITEQPAIIRAIGDQYGFSPRLQAVLLREVRSMKQQLRLNNHGLNTGQDASPATSSALNASPEAAEDKTVVAEDVELGNVAKDPPAQNPLARAPPAASEDMMIGQLVKDILNYTSVDQGDNFFCLGANWLHRRAEEEGSQGTLLPPKHWSWLTLCGDNTVISIHDVQRFEEHPDALDEKKKRLLRQEELANMRSNTINVLCQISERAREDESFQDNTLTVRSVRELLKPEQPGRTARSDPDATLDDRRFETTSNLFYYLFEDYSGSIPVLRSSQQALKHLSERVLASTRDRYKRKPKPEDIIHTLHKQSKELRQLQHLFESYKNLIDRLSRPRHYGAHINTLSSSIQLSTKVHLSQSARHRFDRLGDRVQLLMLNTIKECLEEQSALSTTYFNLMTQKDSEATARLTRSATLLAKLSVFFLPINFMTSYFSVEIPNLVENYTPKTYWVSFAVIAGLSFLALLFFSRLEKLEHMAEKLVSVKKRKAIKND